MFVPPTYEPRGTLYPVVEVARPHLLHQLDLVGPRYLRGGTRFYGVHVIDAYSNAVAVAAVPCKQDTAVVDAVVAAWQRLGIPRSLQVDNELSFRGSNRYPRSLGRLIRLCLWFGVELRFIPEREPWRNGVIERFTDVYDKLVFRSQSLEDLEHLTRELARFEHFHNTPHRYAKLGQQSPWAIHQARRPRRVPSGFLRHRGELPVHKGQRSFVRLTDAAGRVRFFIETFGVHPRLVHEYVVGTISTGPEILKCFSHGKLVKALRYPLTKAR